MPALGTALALGALGTIVPMHSAEACVHAAAWLAFGLICLPLFWDVSSYIGETIHRFHELAPHLNTNVCAHRAAQRLLQLACWGTFLVAAVEAGHRDSHVHPRGGISMTSSAAVGAAIACAAAATGGPGLFSLGRAQVRPERQYTCFSLLNIPGTKEIADLIRFAQEECLAGKTSQIRRPQARRSASMRCTSDGGLLVKDPAMRLVKTAPRDKEKVSREEGMRLKKAHVREAMQVPFPHSENRYALPHDCAWAISESLNQADLPRFRERQLSKLRQLEKKTRKLNTALLASGQAPEHALKLINRNHINIVLVATLIEALQYPDVELPLRLLTGMPVVGDLTAQDSGVFREVWQANAQDKSLSAQGNPELLEFALAEFYNSHDAWLEANRTRMVEDAHAAIRLAKAGKSQRLDLLKRVQRSTENEVWNNYMGPAMSEQELRDKYSRNGRLQARVIPRFPIVQGTKPKRCFECDRLPVQCAACEGHDMPGLRCCDDAKRSGTNGVTRHRETVRCPSFEFPAAAAAEFVAQCDRSGQALPNLLLGCDDIAMAYRTVPNAQPEMCVVAMYDFSREDISYYEVYGLNFGLASAPVQFNRVPEFICTVCRCLFYACIDHYYDDFLVVDVDNAPPIRREFSATNMTIPWTSSAQQTLNHTCSLIGFPLAPAKRKFAASQNELLGVECDLSQFASSARVSFRPTERRLQEIQNQLASMQREASADPSAPVMPPRVAASLLGRLNFIMSSSYASIGRAATLPLVERSNDSSGRSTWEPAFDFMLDFFNELFAHLPPLVFDFRKRTRKPVLVYTDAAYDPDRNGLGIVLFDLETNQRQMVSGEAPPELFAAWNQQLTWINQLELLAVLSAVLTFGASHLAGRQVIFFVDNTSALSSCVHGYSRNTDLAAMSNLLHLALAQLDCVCWFEFVNSAANIADLPTRPQGADADELYNELGLTQDVSLRLPSLQELACPRMHQLFASAGV